MVLPSTISSMLKPGTTSVSSFASIGSGAWMSEELGQAYNMKGETQHTIYVINS